MLEGYKNFDNQITINRNNGTLTFMKNFLENITTIDQFNKLKVLNSPHFVNKQKIFKCNLFIFVMTNLQILLSLT